MNDLAFNTDFGPIVSPPTEDSVFIWGRRNWSGKHTVEQPKGRVLKCSLHKPNFTIPNWPYGFILKITKGGIYRGYDQEISEHDEISGQKFRMLGLFRYFRTYSEGEMDDLLANTQQYDANEIWVKGDKVEIVSAYIYKGDHARGLTAFKHCMKAQAIDIVEIT